MTRVAPPVGEVMVTGYVQESRSGGRFARGSPRASCPRSPASTSSALAEQWGTDLAPVWLQLVPSRIRPSDEHARDPGAPPDLDEGPHLSYAVQWFIFATIGVVGYPLILRRHTRRARRRSDASTVTV